MPSGQGKEFVPSALTKKVTFSDTPAEVIKNSKNTDSAANTSTKRVHSPDKRGVKKTKR